MEITTQNIDGTDALEKWLIAHGIAVKSWGEAGTKTLDNLWHELANHEITLEDDPPARKVQVVQVILRRGDTVLHELAQEFEDGRLRERQQPPSEKIVGIESRYAAAERCLREELGLEPQQLKILPATHPISEQIAESPSYPGLSTHYRIYTVEATADDLPDDDFWRDNEAFGSGDPVRRHLWGWRRVL
jgi:hypothetical protein